LYRFTVMQQLGYDNRGYQGIVPGGGGDVPAPFSHLPINGLSSEQLDYMAKAVLESIEEMQRGE
jgi:hypothetical protein